MGSKDNWLVTKLSNLREVVKKRPGISPPILALGQPMRLTVKGPFLDDSPIAFFYCSKRFGHLSYRSLSACMIPAWIAFQAFGIGKAAFDTCRLCIPRNCFVWIRLGARQLIAFNIFLKSCCYETKGKTGNYWQRFRSWARWTKVSEHCTIYRI